MANKGQLKQNGVHLEEHEYKTVKFMLKLGYDIELIPPAQIKGLQMPDIMMMGKPWEMKSPIGNGKNTIMHTIQAAGRQSSNVILDLRRCRSDTAEVIKKIEYHFKASKRIRRLIVIVNEEKIIDFNKK
jgi:hypothetical protein